MAESQFKLVDNGQEVQQADVNLLGQTSGLADDRVFAEILRLTPTDGSNVFKAILPYRFNGAAFLDLTTASGKAHNGTVCTTGSANGSVQVNPFRAVIGSRTTEASNAKDNWRDIRSGIFIGASGALSKVVALAANASGNPRWDLVYVSVTVDAAAATVTRKVKDPGTSVVSDQTVSVTLGQTVAVAVVTGTPGVSPVVPDLPADGGGTYYIPLAAVRVINGFGAGSTLTPQDIRDYVNINFIGGNLARAANIGESLQPANGNNDGNGAYAADAAFQWLAGTSGQRPSVWLPPQMIGKESRLILFDFTDAAHPSHASLSNIDTSIDWRHRFFVNHIQVDATHKFASDPTASGTVIPGATGSCYTKMGQSFGADFLGPPTFAAVMAASNAMDAAIASTVYLWADATTGALKVYYAASPACRLMIWIQASAQYPNA